MHRLGANLALSAAPLLIAVLVYLLVFYRLTERDLWGSHEARAAQNADSMLHYGDWGLPRLTDERADLQKPPMYYWAVAAVGRLRGTVDAWAVRLPAAASAALCVAAIYITLWRCGRPTAALFAALFLITAQHFTWLARTARIDMPLALCVTLAVITIGLSQKARLLGYLAIAAALLLKGPVGALLPLAVIFGNWLAERLLAGPPSPASLSFGLRKKWSYALGIVAALAIAAPWFIYANQRTGGEFFRVFFWYHNVQRATGGADELAVHPWWYYGPRLMVDALPASLVFVAAIIWFVHRGRWRIDHEARFGLVWLIAVVGVLSWARFKRADYLLPAYPGLALFLGCSVERLWQTCDIGRRRAMATCLAVMVIAALAGWGYVLHVEHARLEPRRECRTFARQIRAIAPAPTPVLFFRVECHALAFHVGRPINTLLEWENLDIWASRPESTYVLMSPDDADEWARHLRGGTMVEVIRNAAGHDRPLVLMRTRPATETPYAAPREQTIDRRSPDQHGPAGAQPGSAAGARRAGVGQRPGETRAAVRDPAGG